MHQKFLLQVTVQLIALIKVWAILGTNGSLNPITTYREDEACHRGPTEPSQVPSVDHESPSSEAQSSTVAGNKSRDSEASPKHAETDETSEGTHGELQAESSSDGS